jgi:NitT/TauT family transport system ATP-binding protein
MSPRPGRIVADVRGEAPGMRTKAFRTSPRYAALCGEISRILLEQTEGRG